jgi:hypothetical protein
VRLSATVGATVHVNFMVIGAQRCGTTTIFDILRGHPGIVACRKKEPEFFSLEEQWRQRVDYYHGLFQQRPGALYFEASTSYTFYPLRLLRVWDSIFDYNPRMKFIYLVRNPIERIVSAYALYYARGFTDLGIEGAIRSTRDFLDVSRYYTQIIPYIRRFGRDQVMILDFDDLVKTPSMVMQRIAAWLEIDATGFGRVQQHSNASADLEVQHHRFDRPALPFRAVRRLLPSVWRGLTASLSRRLPAKPVLSQEYRQMIVNTLELEVRSLEPLVGKDLSAWLVVRPPASS